MFLIIAFVLSVVMLFTWIETSNEYHGFDWVVFLITGCWFFWSILMLSLFGIMTAYTLLLLILGILLLRERIELYLHTIHKILVMVAILLCVSLLVILFKFWNERWLVVGLSLKEKTELGPKPVFFAHRGSPMAGPENTMMAFEKAVEEGAHGLETDVHLSTDRVPFLMHDYDLRRTTNIREVMPEAAYNHPSTFSWRNLSKLNAGEWFVHPRTRPFFNMKPLSEADKKRARNQSIPQLADLLKLAKKEKKFVIFDLFGPPRQHPLRNTYVRQVVSVILASKIEQRLIFWLPGHDRDYVRYMAPGFQHVGRLFSIEYLTRENISIINVDYKRLFYNGLKDYKEANIYINLYLVNEPWIFSLAWCSRINSVTTDNIPRLSQLTRPHFFMTPQFYMAIWLFMDIVSAVVITAIFCYHWWKELKAEKLIEASRNFKGSRSVSVSLEQNENQEASHLPTKPPTRVGETPWTPGLAGSKKKYSDAPHFEEPLKKKPGSVKITQSTVVPVVPPKDVEVGQVPNWEAAGEGAPQTTVPPMEANI
ncbi:glycerophosphodiester phosphodiesterase domain-containing protein 4 isoform X1 [Octodon degus]|uniref:Glycerophosphodiester phosphodiesterase domain-containing protein 4 isoform X1 n=1 Tax=Octodon degus TaxID=10160 RepID=A0A6P6EJF5_OCTDE|nr:glycerophosphodiester phosphodiesterase domain-containing protein 4 isoform X1 [Octodon degus]